MGESRRGEKKSAGCLHYHILRSHDGGKLRKDSSIFTLRSQPCRLSVVVVVVCTEASIVRRLCIRSYGANGSSNIPVLGHAKGTDIGLAFSKVLPKYLIYLQGTTRQPQSSVEREYHGMQRSAEVRRSSIGRFSTVRVGRVRFEVGFVE